MKTMLKAFAAGAALGAALMTAPAQAEDDVDMHYEITPRVITPITPEQARRYADFYRWARDRGLERNRAVRQTTPTPPLPPGHCYTALAQYRIIQPFPPHNLLTPDLLGSLPLPNAFNMALFNVAVRDISDSHITSFHRHFADESALRRLFRSSADLPSVSVGCFTTADDALALADRLNEAQAVLYTRAVDHVLNRAVKARPPQPRIGP